jgi:Photosynthesis system II assembly factor YCF48
VLLLPSGRDASFRGLSVVSDKIIWVSGSNGTTGVSTNGGKDWKWITIPGYTKSDFRDVHAFNEREAVIMGVTKPAVILRTTDAGDTWKPVFTDSSDTFLDAMDFTDDEGCVVGDPVHGKIFLLCTKDRGLTWGKFMDSDFDTAAVGEAFFASSGTNLVMNRSKRDRVSEIRLLVSGGIQSSVYISGKRSSLDLLQGKETTGANSISLNSENDNQAFIVGGDFKNDTLEEGNSLLLQINPFLQTKPDIPPHGYRSCVEYVTSRILVCCGTSGVDISYDGGKHWKLISRKGFHVCQKSRTGKLVFLAGAKGSLGILQL